MEFEEISIDELAELCRQETGKYFQKEKNDSCYCYQLFIKAFGENSDRALHRLYEIYRPLVVSWIHRHPYFRKISGNRDELFFDSMSHFVLTLKKGSINDFPSLSRILSYLRKCVHTEIMTIWRKHSVYVTDLNPESSKPGEDDFDTGIIFRQAWDRIQDLCENPEELLLARLIFTQHLKPRQILKDFPGKWRDSNEIRVVRQKIVRKLQKDTILQKILEGSF